MTVERFITATIVFGLALSLGSCGGGSESGFSAYVADHWPHWAGGMPEDVPPRPGAPGYNEFVAHGQAGQDAVGASPSGTNNAATTAPVFKTTSSAPSKQVTPSASVMPSAQAAPETQAEPTPDAAIAPQPNSDDTSIVKGGLY